MDYLRRDAYFCGVSYGFFDYERLLNTLSITENKIVVDSSGLRALENFFVSRYFMYIQVYFHKVVRILSIHLTEFVKKYLNLENVRSIDDYLKLNDASVISRIFEREEYREDFQRIFGRKHFKTLISTEVKEEYEEAKEKLLKEFPQEKLRFDEIFKEVYEGNVYVKIDGKLKKAEEVSSLIASLKPIEIYRIYVDKELWKKAKLVLEKS